jgi:hypothetical protein
MFLLRNSLSWILVLCIRDVVLCSLFYLFPFSSLFYYFTLCQSNRLKNCLTFVI